jgi:CRP/FNR family transcriptional activator FtrB
MRPEDSEALCRLPLFSTMRQESFGRLTHASFLQRFPAGVDLIAEGDRADFLHVLIEGSVVLFGSAGARESAILIARPVSTFILAAVVHDAEYLMSARTLEPSRILMVPSRTIRELIAGDDAFSGAMLAELAGAFRQLVRAIKDQKLRTGVERLANCLLRLRAEAGGAAELLLPVEKRLLASLLGMTPENLSRAFATLRPYGVAVDGPRVWLSDVDGLARLARPTPLIDSPDNPGPAGAPP